MSDGTLPAPEPFPPASSVPGLQGLLLQQGLISAPLHPGQLGALDHYQLLSVLGQGGMGIAFKALDTRDGKTVAIKVLRPELAAHPQQVHRFLKESRHMQRLRHPHILPVLGVSNNPEAPYFATPHMERGSLVRQLSEDHPYPESDCLAIARQIAAALTHAHAKGVIHRDLKPGNVLLDASGNAFLADFGLARTIFNDSLVDAGKGDQGEGTVHYLSPQLARGEAEDTRCDIYALGALLYEMVSGHPPYEGPSAVQILQQIRKGPPKPITKLRPDLSPALVTLIEGAMAREHRDRYANMADVIADLDCLDKGVPPKGPRPSFGVRRLIRTLGPFLATIACVIALAASAILGHKWATRGYELEIIGEFSPVSATSWAEAQIGDWDGDGEADLVQVKEGKLEAFSSTGQRVKPVPIGKADDIGLYLGMLEDITGDGMAEGFVTWNRGSNAHLAAYNQLGWPVREFVFPGSIHVDARFGTNYTRLRPSRITDLEGDGRKELLVIVTSTWALRPRGLACFDLATSKLLWSLETANLITDATVCDLNGDNRQEIVLGGNSPSNGAFLPDGTDDRHAYIHAISPGGQPLWRHELAGVFARVTPIKRSPVNKTVAVWVSAGHAYSVRSGEPDTGEIIEFDAAGNVVHEHDFGIELTSALAVDLNKDGHDEFLASDRLGILHVLDQNLQEIRAVTLEKPLYDEVQVQLSGALNLGPPGAPHIVLATSQLERKYAPQVGDSPELVENVFYHDNRVMVINSTLNPIASRLVNAKWSTLQNPGFRVAPLRRGTKSPDLFTLGLDAQVLRLKRSPLFGSNPSKRETGE